MYRVITLLTITAFLSFSSCTPPAKYGRAPVVRTYSVSRSIGRSIVSTAKKYIGVKYRYGGNDPRGFDCSGFSNYIYRKNNYKIPRSAKAQFRAGKRITIKRARPGDLVFFKIYRNRISHVGIYLGNYSFIHSPRSGKRVSCEDMRKDYWRKRYAGTVTYFR